MNRHLPWIGCAIALLAAGPVAAQPAWTSHQDATIDSRVLGEKRVVRVWTPAACATSGQRCPVLYLTDADAQMFHTAATVDFLARQDRIPAMIVVGVTNTDRTRDLTPTRATIEGANVPPFPTSGGADAFLRFFETELIPWVEKTYRTQPFRAFAGHSFGGLFATHALLSKPDLFNAVIAVSPTLRWDGGLPLKQMRSFVASHAGQPVNRSFLFTIGSEGAENDRAFDEMKTILASHTMRGFAWEAWRFADEDHGSVVLPSHLAALRKIFDDWRLPRETDGTFTGTLDDVKAHYARLSTKLGYAVRTPEVIVNLLGYQRLAQKRADDALAFLRYNVEQYPESANVYDSLGEALEAKGELKQALELYEQAVTRGTKNQDALLPAFLDHRDALRAKLAKQSSSR